MYRERESNYVHIIHTYTSTPIPPFPPGHPQIREADQTLIAPTFLSNGQQSPCSASMHVCVSVLIAKKLGAE